VAGVASFSNGDGLCFVNDKRELEGFRVNRVEGNRLFPLKMPANLRPGLRLYRNNDQEMERLLGKKSAERKISVRMSLRATADGFSLQMGDAVGSIVAEHQEAQKDPRENIIRQLTKLGGTPYECSEVDIPADFNFFIPSSLLTELRRKTVDAMASSSILHHPSSILHHPSSILHHPSSILHHPSSIYKLPYLYNASNALARAFYEQQGIQVTDAFEVRQPAERLIMQCRHCLRFALGRCVKHGGRKPEWKEPLSLRLGDGRQFRLEFDCRHCQMNIYADE
jgi:putative protease